MSLAGLDKAPVAGVVDGDTLRLRGGQSVRLIGINTPELGRDGRADQPLARLARRALVRAVDAGGGAVWLLDGRESRDRYGRRLAYGYDGSGNSLSSQLLRAGLGFHVAFSPNDALVGCLRDAEASARDEGRGIWEEKFYDPVSVADLPRRQGGFKRLRDRVTHVSFKANGWWIQLGGKVGVRVRPEDRGLFNRASLAALDGREVEVRGWLAPMDGGWWTMQLGHPAMLEVLP